MVDIEHKARLSNYSRIDKMLKYDRNAIYFNLTIGSELLGVSITRSSSHETYRPMYTCLACSSIVFLRP